MNVFRYLIRKKRVADLWNLRVEPGRNSGCCDCLEKNDNTKETMAAVDEKSWFIIGAGTDENLKKTMADFCEHLTDADVKTLRGIAKGKNNSIYGPCLMLPTSLTAKSAKAQHSKYSPLLLTCRLWRWTDLGDTKELRRLSHVCPGDLSEDSGKGSPESSQSGRKECCNPYHWSRQVPEPQSPARKRDTVDQEKPLLDLLSDTPDMSFGADEHEDEPEKKTVENISSMETGISRIRGGQLSVDSSSETVSAANHDWTLPGRGHANLALSFPTPPVPRHHWCTILCWEERERLGGKSLFQVVHRVFNVLYDTPGPQETGLSLASLENKKRSEDTKKVRSDIGLGIAIIYDEEKNEIFIYNRLAKHPVFISSRYLDYVYRGHEKKVIRVGAGYSIKAFDLKIPLPQSDEESNVPNLTKFSSIFVSFCKGWGTGYSRRQVVDCNCWLEICLDNVTRKRTR